VFTGVVRGEIWATRRHETLEGLKLLLVEPYDVAERLDGGHRPHGLVVAADAVDAGVGDEVIVAYGRAGRTALGRGHDIAVEAAVVGVVDDRTGPELH
jgi:ethanolamine utilization protein EutN